MKKFITFGEPMVMFAADTEGELFQQEKFTKYMAGAEVNVAIGMARLGYDTTFVSCVGMDSFGKFIREYLEKEKISTDHIFLSEEYPTGYQLKSRVSEGDPQVEYYRKFAAFRQISREQMEDVSLDTGTHLHATGIPLALSASVCASSMAVLEKARRQGCSVSFDPNLRPVLWESSSLMRDCINEAALASDLVLPGISEGEFLTGEKDPQGIADFYLSRGVGAVIVKLGSKGAYFCNDKGESGFQEGVKDVKVVDTVGAGDGFAVGAVSALLEGETLREASVRGNAIGALAVQSPGDHDGLPDREALRSYLNKIY